MGRYLALVLPLAAFVATVIGVTGKTLDDTSKEFLKFTPIGWVAIFTASVILIVSVYIEFNKIVQKAKREKANTSVHFKVETQS